MRITWGARCAAILMLLLGQGPRMHGTLRAAQPSSHPPGLERELARGSSLVLSVPAPADARLRSVLIAIEGPGRIPPGSALEAGVEPVPARAGSTRIRSKTPHLGDPDVAWIVRQDRGESLRIAVRWPAETGSKAARTVRVAIRVADLGPAEETSKPGDEDSRTTDRVAFETEPNDTPESACRLVLGQTVYGLADDRAYLPMGEQPAEEAQESGVDWYTFTHDEESPRLAFFALDFVDRDIPPDVRVYRKKDGRLVEYTEGIDPQSLQRERPPRPGANKFTTRVIARGTYFVRVDACQPDYQLRTKLFDVPPYLKAGDADKATPEAVAASARKAIRTAMDFQLLAGDSWHANTPRKGHPMDRVANFHHETSTCIACHPTHFTTQSALAAVKAGYDVEQPFALQFLTERLANNPVPFHGHEGALWARMIPAPANVLSRLSTIVMDYEDRVAGARRDNLHRGIAEFLKLYYDGRNALPPDESNGNNPVSRYKVATDSWRQLDAMARRTGDSRYAETRDLVARLLPTGKPANTRDLAAQTIGLCLRDPGRQTLAEPIDANVRRLISLQRPDGHWSVKFDPSYPITEMQTGESLYALTLAGRRPDDPAMRRGIVALLTRQQAFGGWFDVNPYEQFRTPFRETQWALMALSTLYPSPRPRPDGWNGPLGPQPRTLRAGSPATLIRDLEQIWDVPAADLQRAVIAQLGHEAPMVRYAACRSLGRVGDGSAIEGLSKCLGDESKVVRRAAADAMRLLGNRLNGSTRPGQTEAQRLLVDRLRAALASPDDRTRRGATRVFAAHFRELSQELSLADAMLERLDDPDPVVAMQAIKGLWRWWYWRSDPGLRNRIEDRLIAGLAEPRHPWVRRNLIEALYIIGDDNIRYLDNNWIPSLARAEDRRRATDGQHATVNRLGDKFVGVLESGDRLQREGVLRAMSEFFERPVLGGRIGNDLEPTLFHGETAARLAKSLTARMGDPDPTIRRLAIQALVTIRGDRSADLARSVMRRLGDPDAAVRTWAATMTKEFSLKVAPGHLDPETMAMIDELLAQRDPDAQAAALGVLGRIGPVASSDVPATKVRSYLGVSNPTVRAAALTTVRSFPVLWVERPVREAIERGLHDADARVRVASIRMALEPRSKIADAALRKALDDPDPATRIALLDRIASEDRLRSDLRLIGVMSGGLMAENGGVREKALQLIQKNPALLANGEIENALREIARTETAGQRHREIARSLLASRGRSSAGDGTADRLDVAFFKARVLPIFNRMGEDGQNCVGCHRSHTILRMVPPGKDGDWTTEDVRANYRSALRVVNLARPSDSLLLGKPTWEAAEEAEAQNDPSKKAHAGGVRFEPGSREYQTLLDWINGARLPAGPKSASR
jgi:HEAT repeat protein